MMARILRVGLIAVVTSLVASSARADDEANRAYVEAKASLELALDGSDAGHITKKVAAFASAAKNSKDVKQKKDARKVLKRLLKHRNSEIVIAALRGYGEIALAKSSSDLKPLVVKKKCKAKSKEVRIEAMKAYARIHDPGTHEELLEYVRLPSKEADALEFAQVAAEALKAYKDVPKRHRYALLNDYMRVFNMVYTAGVGVWFDSVVGQKWWKELEPPMVETFNLLTGNECSNYGLCENWWKLNKKAVKSGKR